MDSLSKAFGPYFKLAMDEALRTEDAPLEFEAGQDQYVRFDVGDGGTREKLSILRNEINSNLERIISTGKRSEPQAFHNQFKGMVARWKQRYGELCGQDSDSEKTFKLIGDLLEGDRRTIGTVARMAQRALGVPGGALFLVYAAMLATGSGMGLIYGIVIWLGGIPVVKVFAWTVGGIVLIFVSRKEFTPANAYSMVVKLAYRLIDAKLAAEEGASAKRTADGPTNDLA
jgi:hypothetical protein